MISRFVTYNILYGGKHREDAIHAVLEQTQADVIVLQEVGNPAVVERLSERLGLQSFIAYGNSPLHLALLSRYPIQSANSYRPRIIHRALLGAQIAYAPNRTLNVFGVHLIAPPFQIFWEWRRVWELRQVLRRVAAAQPNPCILAGDFNAIAPNDVVEVERIPWHLRLLFITLQGGHIAQQAIAAVQRAGLLDAYRLRHPAPDTGRTLPAFAPTVRLDYIFVNAALREAVRACEVVTQPSAVRRASDHLPVLLDLDI